MAWERCRSPSEAQIAAIVRQAERARTAGASRLSSTLPSARSGRSLPARSGSAVNHGGEFRAHTLESECRPGMRGATVSAELYKLLVYERKGFFLPHRDTEKTGGMFGTLVVTLPSRIAVANCGFGTRAARSP